MAQAGDVSSGLATLGATGWAANEGYTHGSQLLPSFQAPSVVLMGDSITQRNNLGITVASGNVSGNGTTTTITASAQNVLDGLVNLSQSGSPALDHKIVQATNVDGNTFTVPSTLVGNPPSSLVIGVQSQFSERGWFMHANMLMAGKFQLLNNAAIGGETTADMLARMTAHVLAYSPKFCLVMAGLNDCVAGTAAATTFANLRSMYTLCVNAGIVPIALTVLPLATGHANFATAMPRILQLNQLIKNHCAQSGILCVDAYTAIADSAAANGGALNNTLESDFVHPACYGARLVGAAVASALSGIPTAPKLTVSQADNFGADSSNWNLMDQAPWLTSGGTAGAGVSGTVASGFTCQRTGGSGTAVASVNARTVANDGDTIGQNQTLVITSGGASDAWQIFPSSVRLRLVVGATYQFRCALRLNGIAGSNLQLIQTQMQLQSAGANVAQVRALGNENSVALAANYVDGIYYITSPVFTVPSWFSNSAAGFMIMQFNFSAAGTPLTINTGRWTMQRIT